MSIFISHSSKDQEIIDLFVEKILRLGCGIEDNQIFCTSIEGLGIRTGDDFREHIKSKLKQSDYSFIMISNNYRQSEVCINEMGASWALDDLKVKQFIFPKLGFDSLGLLMNVQQASKLNDSSALDELYEELKLEYKTNIKITRWNKQKNDFLNAIGNYSCNYIKKITPSPNNYFNSFIKENASLNHILLKAHPTLLDCKKVFTKNHYKAYFEKYCNEFEDLNNKYFEPLYPGKKYCKIYKSNTTEMENGINIITGGMVKAAQNGFLRSGIEFYSVQFLENENDDIGTRINVFCYIDERWVFFPKPWRMIYKK